jgi:hypothetical protein
VSALRKMSSLSTLAHIPCERSERANATDARMIC